MQQRPHHRMRHSPIRKGHVLLIVCIIVFFFYDQIVFSIFVPTPISTDWCDSETASEFCLWLRAQSISYKKEIISGLRSFATLRDFAPYESKFIDNFLIPNIESAPKIYTPGSRGIVITIKDSREHVDLAKHLLELITAKTQPLLPVEFLLLEDREWSLTRREICDVYRFVTCKYLFDPKWHGFKPRLLRLSSRKYEVCIYAVALSSFEEVMILDVDAMPLINLNDMFENSKYQETGQIFYSDYWNSWIGINGETVKPKSGVWDLVKVKSYPGYEGESGILVINKKIHWDVMLIALHLTRHAQLMADRPPAGYPRPIWGDKDMWRIVFLYLRKSFWMGQIVLLGDTKDDTFCGPTFGQIHPTIANQIAFAHQPKSNKLPYDPALKFATVNLQCANEGYVPIYGWRKCAKCLVKNAVPYDFATGRVHGNSTIWQFHQCIENCDPKSGTYATYETKLVDKY